MIRMKPLGPLAAVVGVAAALIVGSANSAATTDVQPFVYTFRVQSLTVEGTAKPAFDGAAVTVHLHLAKPSRTKSLRWNGKHDGGPNNGDSGAAVPLAGTMVFTDASDPSCSRTVQFSPTRAREILSLNLLNARDRVVTHPVVAIGISNYPIELDNKGGGSNPPKCGYAFKSTSGVSRNYPLSLLHRPGFTIRVHRIERIPSVGSIDWTVVMTVRRVRFTPLSCAQTKGC
jgi:hypothetical protein